MSRILLLLLLISLSSCASIFGNKRQEIEFNSEPAGAKVYLNGKYIGNTPVKYNIGVSNSAIEADNGKWDIGDKYHDITYVKDSFYKEEFTIHRSRGGTWSMHTKNNILCGIDLFFSIPLFFIPAIIDLDVGVCDKFQSSYFKALEEKKINTETKIVK
jgi:hypothetical protein